MGFKKAIFFLSLIVCIFLSLPAFAAQWGDFTYEESGGTITITGYTGAGGAVEIPDNITDIPVVSIGYEAFSYQTRIAGIIIPYSVTSIGDYGFYRCTGLTSVAIPSSVTSIGNAAFSGCTGLTSVAIPRSVTSIGDMAFEYCTGLTSIDVDVNNTAYSSQDGVLYNKAKTMLMQYPAVKSGSFTIPGSVTSIGDYSFSYCTSLTSVTIPSSVTSIGSFAFYDCTGVTSVTIPSSVTKIGDMAFLYCIGLTSIDVDASNTAYSSQDGVLYNKAKTMLMQYPEGKSGGFTIPGSVTSIRGYSFSYSYGLTSVAIPRSVTSIGDMAFEYCTGLTSIDVDVNNTAYSSQDGVLYNKAKTRLMRYPDGKSGGFTIPGSVTSIESHSFCICSGLTSVAIPRSVTSIGNTAFYCCTGLTSAYFYGNAPTMGSNVFSYCASSFKAYYLAGSTGFTNPWYGYPTSVFTLPDTDGDGVPDALDNCPNVYNPQQLDANSNGIGDMCDPTPGCGGCGQAACEQYADSDHDGIPDVIDNCPNVYNPQQLDANGNGIGDCCDPTPGCGGCGQPACDTVCTK